jgi:hypothetical protein
LKRRTSPEYITATRWVAAHHNTIAELLARGFTWVSITNLVPVVPESNEASPTLEMLIVEYESVTAPHIPEPEPTSQLIPQAAAPVDPPTQQDSRALKTKHESPAICIPSRRAQLIQVVRATRDQNPRGGHEVKTRNKPSKPTPIQVVRARFTEITEWRAQGDTWAEICNRLQSVGLKISTKALCAIYQREFKRRNSPPYIAAAQWALANNAKITNLRDQGASWLAIADSVPPQPASNGDVPTLNMLITEYELVASRKRISTSIPIRQTDNEVGAALKDSPSPFHRVM